MLRRKIPYDLKRTGAQIVNKSMLQVLIGSKGAEGAVKATRTTTAGRIKKDLGAAYHGWTFKGGSHRVKLIFLLASKSLVFHGVKFINWKSWNLAVAEMARRIAAARDSSRSFLQAGWLHPARLFGARNNRPVKSGGRASRSRGKRATPEDLSAFVINNAVENKGGGDNPATYAIAAAGLNQAVANETKNIERYIVRKEYEQILQKHSD